MLLIVGANQGPHLIALINQKWLFGQIRFLIGWTLGGNSKYIYRAPAL